MTAENGFDATCDYDVIIIGSGPAGCAAALNCRHNGLSVLLVTTQKAYKHSPDTPSESVPPGVMSLLRHLDAEVTIENAITGTYPGIMSNGHTHFFGTEKGRPLSGYHINKACFTDALLKLATTRGATVLFGETVSDFVMASGAVVGVVTKNGATYISKCVIDCSGSKRIAGKKLHFNELFHSPPVLVCSVKIAGISEKQKNSLAQFTTEPGGWKWTAVETDTLTHTALSLKGNKNCLLGSGLKEKVIRFNMRWRSFSTMAMPGIILCGDAGCIIDPAAGQGILNALLSAIRASEAVIRIIATPQNESEYLAVYSNWFVSERDRKVALLRDSYNMTGVAVFT